MHGWTSPRDLNPNEPQIEAAAPAFDTPPDELTADPVAVAEWQRIVPLLRVSGIISAAERSILIALCHQWSQYLQAQADIRAHGMIVTSAKGPMRNPSLSVALDTLQQMRQLWAELGLTPSARSRLSKLPTHATAAPASRWGNDI